MKITQLPSEHWLEYKKLRLEAVQDSPQSFLATVEETEAETDAEWQDKIKNMLFAVNEAGELVGMVGVYSDRKVKLKHIANIVSVYVKPDYRGQGIGKKLLEAALTSAKANPEIAKIQLGVITTQDAARHLYKSLGFKKVGELKRAVKIGDTFYDEHLMEILL